MFGMNENKNKVEATDAIIEAVSDIANDMDYIKTKSDETRVLCEVLKGMRQNTSKASTQDELKTQETVETMILRLLKSMKSMADNCDCVMEYGIAEAKW